MPGLQLVRALLTSIVAAGIVIGIIAGTTAAATIPNGQAGGAAGTVDGTVTDAAGAAVPGASATLANSVTGYKRTATSDEAGRFRFENIPENDYQLTVSADGFNPTSQMVSVRSAVPVSLTISLAVVGVAASVTVTASVIENVPASHTDVGEGLISRQPPGSPGGGLNNTVAGTAPAVARDANNFFHPLGDHGQTSFVFDNQVISDQRSKTFSTQMPNNAIQSVEIISGAVPAEYGDKSTMIVIATTRSGLALKQPTGSFNSSYGTFGTFNQDGTFGIGAENWGNFAAFNFERSGRFLDAPEFTVLHDRGNSSTLFDRVDYLATNRDALHLDLFLSRNNFQIPNQFDQQARGQAQSQLVRSINVAGGYVHSFTAYTLLTLTPYYRLDQVWYFPSPNPLSDQITTIGQQRRLTNAGIRADISYTKGIHNFKAGTQISHTFLTEADQFGITDPNFNNPNSPNFRPGLLPFDLTRGGHLFTFNGHTDIKQEAFYVQDLMTLRRLTLSLGFRFDNYNGIVYATGPAPRVGASYLIAKTNTVIRGSYIRTFETPYNENLILSSSTGAGGLAASGVIDFSTSNQPLRPGNRNQFNTGFQQAIGKYFVIDGDYFWKYTHTAYDFNVLLNTPIAFPISWSLSKIDGFGIRANLSDYKGLSIYFVAGRARARFFPPEVGGLFFNSEIPSGVFRIDHDQAFQETTNVYYQFNHFKKLLPYVLFTWQYDSGLVAGSVPDFATALQLTPNQQAQIGLFCGNVFATPTQGITDCTDPLRGATLVEIPPEGTANPDTNPPRIAARYLFSLGVGSNNLLRTDRVKLTLRLSSTNLTNKKALYNFLSTFSGTHFVSPRTFQVQMGLVF
jgi:hypothetical protein